MPVSAELPIGWHLEWRGARAGAIDAIVQAKKAELASAQIDAERYTGGLVAAIKQTTVATLEQTLATLELEYLAAKYGLAIPPVGHGASTPPPTPEPPTVGLPGTRPEPAAQSGPLPSERLIGVQLLGKRLSRDMLILDLHFWVAELERPARAVKGVLLLKDLFDETKMSIGWTLEKPPQPGKSIREDTSGFSFNQFMEQHKWVANTALEDIRPWFRVASVIFADGSRVDF